MNDNSENIPNLHDLAAAIQEDFRRLLATLSNEIGSLDDPESEVLLSLWNAKLVAERGLRLSENLAKSIDGAA